MTQTDSEKRFPGRIAVMGGGSWATALAKLLLKKCDSILWYMRRDDRIEEFQRLGHNPAYLTDVTFDINRIEFSSDINEVATKADTLLLVMPSPYFKSHMEKLTADISDKHIVLFSCGLADPEDPENVAHIESGLEKVLTPEMRGKIKQFHLRGGIDYSHLGLKHRAMMAMLRRVMLKKGYDNLRGEDQMMLDTYGGTVDFTDRVSLAPLLNYVRALS